MPTLTQEVPQAKAPVAPVQPDFGNGRYSALMRECYKDSQHILGLEPKIAEKLARQLASDVGALMARDGAVSLKFGKRNKDGYISSLADIGKVKLVKETPSFTAAIAMIWANQAGANGFVWKECHFTWDPDKVKLITDM